MAYKAPIWEDGKSPAISAENLNNLSQAAECAQVLYGNSAPTSSTEGAVGQFYLVVGADSDGNYPLYQCVAIANGSYTWRDTRRISDSITSMLGIPAPGTINSALNVLAHVGNLHVWENKQLTDVPAHITENAVSNLEVFYATAGSVNPTSSRYSITYYVADFITVNDSGDITLSDPTEVTCYIPNSTYSEYYNADALKGKYIKVKELGSSYVYNRVLGSGVFKIAQNAVFSVSNPNSYTGMVTVDKAYSCVGIPLSKDGTITYLTSTDRNAYPDESSDGSSYLLGESESKQVSEYYDTGTTRYLNLSYSDSVVISGNGSSVELNNPTTVEIGANASANFNVAKGKFCKFFQTSDTSVTVSITDLVFIPSDAEFSLTYPNSRYTVTCSKVQSVTVIPCTITYLGQLGGGARIEVGSYVGTGTYGSSNPNTLTFGFEPQLVAIFSPSGNGNYAYKLFMLRNVLGASIFDPDGNNNGVIVTWSEKSVTWYVYESKNATYQMNRSNYTYHYIAIG